MNQWFSIVEKASVGPFGQAVLSLSFFVALLGFLFAAVGAYKRQPRYTEAALHALHLFTGLISVCVLLLVYSLFTHDFSLKYVQDYSNATQHTIYRITALWGGQAGSLLFWVFLMSLYGAATFGVNRERLRAIMPHSIAVYMIIALFFTSMLLLKANPFEMQRLGEIPADGAGMNPLLQTPLMTIHPPSLYLGYVGFAIPFCFAMGALMANRLDSEWIRATRKATMISFTFLSIGNILGSWWAYEEIGWGGFWAWDPVETAAFFPWLTGTAFLHSVMIQERKGMFKVWNVVLISLTFFLTILGTMLTRSGLVQSVHAFANSRVGTFFGVFLLLIATFSIAMIIYRWKALRTIERGDGEFHVVSREFSFLAQNIILTIMAITLVVFVLTPMITKEIIPWIQENLFGTPTDQITRSEATMGPRFYNIYMAPMALALLFLMGVGPLIPWKKATPGELIKAFFWPLVSSGVAAVFCILVGITAWFPMAVFVMAAFVTGTITQEFVQGVGVRKRTKKEGFSTALVNLVLKGKRRYGGYVVHLGMVAVFLGIAGAYYQGQRSFAGVKVDRRAPDRVEQPYDFAVDPWKTSFEYGGYEFHYYDLRVNNTPDTEEYRTYVAIKKEGKPFGLLTPGRNWYRTHPDQPSSEIDVKEGLGTDLYMSLASYDDTTAEAAFVVTINPLIVWLWMGLFIILLGCGICLAPEVDFQRPRVAGPIVVSSMAVGLLLFLMAPIAMAQEDHNENDGHNHASGPPAGPSVADVQVANGVTVIDYPAAVKAASGKLVCRCPCGQIVATCAMPQCECVEDRKHMSNMVAQGASEQDLVDWYVKSYGSRYLALDNNSGLGKQLGASIWLVVAAGLGVLILAAILLTKNKPQPAIAGVEVSSKTPLSAEDEKKLAEITARLE